MTDKRFDWDLNGIWDYQSDTDEYLESSKEICELLNELHETNEQLRHDATILIQSNQDYRKENEELKQSNERLLKMLDNVANYMQKQNKYMPIDDFVEWWNGIATKGLDGDVE